MERGITLSNVSINPKLGIRDLHGGSKHGEHVARHDDKNGHEDLHV
jgi:hypothetical protein